MTDVMIKEADIKLISANSICPGKYIVMISGDVGAVKASIEAGIAVGGSYIVNSLVLPNLNGQIIPAITGTTEITYGSSLGALEFFSISSAIVAADAAAKEIRLGLAVGGKAFITLTGDVSAVTAAVEAGTEVGKKSGMLICKTIIPRVSAELLEKLI